MGIFLIFRNDAGLTMYEFSAKVRLHITTGLCAPTEEERVVIESQSPSDAELKATADIDFTGSRPKQVIAKLISLLRVAQLPGMTYADMQNRFPPTDRMRWMEKRPDIRARVVNKLSGLDERIARRRDLSKQAEEIEEALVDVVSCQQYEDAFSVEELATYGDGDAYVKFFVEGFVWTNTDDKSRVLIGVLCGEFLTAPPKLDPPLTHLQARRAISSTAWQTYVPTELRAKVDDARLLKQEQKPREPFTAKDEMDIVTTVLLAKHLPLEELKPVFLGAMKALGFEVSISKPPDTQPSMVNVEKPPAETPSPEGDTATLNESVDLDGDSELAAAIEMDAEEGKVDPTSDGTQVFARAIAGVSSAAFDRAREQSPVSHLGPNDRSSQTGVRLEELQTAAERGLPPPSRREPPKIPVPPFRGKSASKP